MDVYTNINSCKKYMTGDGIVNGKFRKKLIKGNIYNDSHIYCSLL